MKPIHTTWRWGLLVILAAAIGTAVRAQNPCMTTNVTCSSWNCTVGSVNNPGTLTATNVTICLGENAGVTVGGATFNDGSKVQFCSDNCDDQWSNTASITYTANYTWTPPLPSVFTNTGIFYYTNEVQGISQDPDCPQNTAVAIVGTLTVIVSNSLVIISQPTNQTVALGDTATFSVLATACPALTYQWYFNTNTILTGQTNSILTLSDVQLTNAGDYSVVVSDYSGSITSSQAVLTVYVAPCIEAPSSIISWWPGEGNADDIIGTNNGILVNGVTFTNGIVGEAFHFNGSNQDVQIPYSTSLEPTNVTVECWVKLDALASPVSVSPGLQYIVFKQNSMSYDFEGYDLEKNRINGQDVFRFQVSSGGVQVPVNSTTTVLPGVWYHLAGTYDGTTVKLYVNGVLEGSATAGFPLNYGTEPVYFGTTGESFDGRLEGALDEVSIYNRALSSNQIAAIYQAGSAGKCLTPTNLIPVITAFSPALAATGTVVNVTGLNFSSTTSNNIVYFGAVQAVVSSASTTNLVVTVPAGATFAPITETVNGLTAYSPKPFLPTFSGVATNFSLGSQLVLPTGSSPSDVIIADLDGDGKPDLAVDNGSSHTIYVYRNISTNGTLTTSSFASPVVLPIGTGGQGTMVAADLTGDGKLDLVCEDLNSNLVIVIKNLCTPGNITTNSFARAVTFAVGNGPRGVAVQDMDGDGKPDIISANFGDSTVSVLRNISTPGTITTNSFEPAVAFATGTDPQNVVVADIDGDGQPDLVTVDNNYYGASPGFSVLRNTSALGNMAFDSHVDFPGLVDTFWVAVGDVDGDGKPDVVIGSQDGNQGGGKSVSVYRNTSTPGIITTNSFAPHVDFYATNWVNSVALADLNGDGKLDVAAALQILSSQMDVFLNTSTPGVITNNSLASPLVFGSGYNPVAIAVGDLNGDGRPDIAFVNSYDNTLSIYQNTTPVISGTPPVITVQPTNQTIAVGSTAAFSVTATGSAPLSYQWQFNGTNLSGMTNTVLNITNAQAANAGPYTVVVSNPEGSVTSDVAALTVETPPTVPPSGQPQSTNIVQGGTLYLSVSAAGSPPLYYQWAYNGVNISGATSSTYTKYVVQGADAGDYSVVVNNSFGSATSSNAILTVDVPLTITQQPTNESVMQGSNATFTVTATGTLPLSYQWWLNGTNLLASKTNTWLTITNAQTTNEGDYTVVITNIVGSVTSLIATLTVDVPVGATPLDNLAVCPGSPATFYTMASGTPPYTYTWYFNSSPLSGETNSSLTINNAGSWNVGTYSVVVTGPYGSPVTNSATLAMNTPVSATALNNSTNVAGTTATFSTTASGTGPYQFAWYQNGTVISGQTGSSLTLNSVESSSAGVYSVVVSGACNSVTNNATLLVLVPPVIANPPSSVSTNAGANVSFSVTISTNSTVPLSYQWYFNTNSLLSGDTNTALNLADVQAVNAGYYSVIVTNFAGSVTSSFARLIVTAQAPIITLQPTNQSVVVGNGASFSVTAIGTQPLGYQWRLGGTNIASQTNSTYTLSDVQTTNAGNYTVVITNSVGSVTSSVAALTVLIAPTVSIVSPVNGSRFADLTNLTITAFAQSADTNISEVEFFLGNGAELGAASVGTNTGYYSFVWTNIQPGAYELTAVAIDGNGVSATSSAVVFTNDDIALDLAVNLDGPAETNLQGLVWESFAYATNNGLSYSTNAATNYVAVSKLNPSTDTGTSNMLQDMLTAYRLPTISQQTGVRGGGTLGYGDCYVRITLTGFPGGYMITNESDVYRGWCINAGLDSTSTKTYPCEVYYSYGDPDPRYQGVPMNEINYLLNNKQGTNIDDIQNAIWTLLGQANTNIFTTNTPYTPTTNYIIMTNQACLYGTNFVPGCGQVGVCILDPTNHQPLCCEIGSTNCGSNSELSVSFTITQTNHNENLTNGYYYVYGWLVIDPSNSISENIALQGQTVATGIGANLTNGEWLELGPYGANVTNGTLSITVSTPSVGNPVLMGMAIYGCQDSNASATVSIIPTNQTQCPGQSATFDTTVSGIGPFSYVWSFDGSVLSGQTGSSLVLNNVSSANAGTYSVLVTAANGAIATNSATLTISTNLTVTPPLNSTNCPGTTATFTTAAFGTGPFEYAWYYNGSLLTNQTTGTLEITNVQSGNAGIYTAVVTGGCGNPVTNSATLTVNVAVSATPLTSFTNCPGTVVTFTTAASGTGPFDYIWYKNGVVMTNQYNNSLYLTNVSFADAGTYSVEVIGACGTPVTNSAMLVLDADVSATPLVSITNLVGTAATFSTTAYGAVPYLYSWYQNGILISNQANNTLTISNVTLSDQGIYSVVVMGGCGAPVTNSAALTVWQPPTVVITSPVTNSFLSLSNITVITATASSPDSDITNVVFFAGTNLIGSGVLGASNTYDIAWFASPIGTNFLTAVATDGNGLNATSPPIDVIVINSGPSIQILSPINQTFPTHTHITIQATTSIVLQPTNFVEILASRNGGPQFVVGNAPASPSNAYQFDWPPGTNGTYVLTAEITGTNGLVATSAPVTDFVINNPSVSWISPTNGQTFLGTPTINTILEVSAIPDPSTIITNVTFFWGTSPQAATNRMGSVTSGTENVYSFPWGPVVAGAYDLAAEAFDTNGGIGWSATIAVTVITNQPPGVYAPNLTNYLSTNAVEIQGFVTYEGLFSNSLSVTWTNISGPAPVTMTTTTNPTYVYFTNTGVYQFVISASASGGTAYWTNTVTILPPSLPPIVFAGPWATLVLPELPSTNPLSTIQIVSINTNALAAPTGIDYFPPSNSIVLSVYYGNGSPYNFELINSNGFTNQFSSISNLSDEVYISTVRSTNGGFNIGEMFTGSGQPGGIMRIEPDGSTIGTNQWTDSLGYSHSNEWVILPTITLTNGTVVTPGLLRGGLWVDRTGVWGGDLIVSTTQGGGDSTSVGYVWRVNSKGQATFIAQMNANPNVGSDSYEGVTTCPNNVQQYGPWAGKILVGGDSAGDFFAVDTNGFVTPYTFPFGSEDIRVITANENFYGCDQNSTVYGAPASQFQGMVGDILDAWESSGTLYRIHWDGTNFDWYQIRGYDGHPWEGVNFAPAGLLGVPAINYVQLQGVIIENGNTTTNAWNELSGPAPVTFNNPSLTNALATFTVPGTYILQLSAYDGAFSAYSNTEVTVIRDQAPYAYAGTNQVISTLSTEVQGIVTNISLPPPYNVTNILWVPISGPSGDTPVITYPTQASTPVTFSAAGTYIFQLRADNNGQVTNFSDVTITVDLPILIVSPTNSWPALTNTPYTVTAQLLSDTGSPMAHVPVTFSFSGNILGYGSANGGSLTTNTDANGYAYFSDTNENQNIGADTIEVAAPNATPVYAVINWAQDLPCDMEVTHSSYDYSGCFSMDWPTNTPHYADYYYFTGVTDSPVALTYYRTDGSPISEALVLRDPSNSIVDISYNGVLNYTPLISGNYLLEVAELSESYQANQQFSQSSINPTPSYTLSLSCDGGQIQNLQTIAVQLLDNGTNILNPNLATAYGYGPVVFPPTLPALATNITLTFSNSGSAPISIGYFNIEDDDIDGQGENQSADFTTNNVITVAPINPGMSTNLTISFLSSTNAFVNGDFSFYVNGNYYYDVQLVADAVSSGITPPQIQIVTPPNGAEFYCPNYYYYGQQPVTAGALAIPDASGLNTLEWFYSGWYQPNIVNASATNYFTTQVYPTTPGPYVFNATVVDNDGGMGQATPVTIYGTMVPPQMQVFYNGTNVPSGGTIILPTTLTNVPVVATLVVSNPASVALEIDNLETNSEFTDGDFSLVNDDSGSTTYFGDTTNINVSFNALTNGTFIGGIGIDAPGTADGTYIVYMVASAFPAGAPPTVQIVSPTLEQSFYAPANITITAFATNGASPINYVDFQELGTNGNVDFGEGTALGGGNYALTTPSLPAGTYTFIAIAVDTSGRSTTSSPVTVQVIVGAPPVTIDVTNTVLTDSRNNIFNVLANDYSPSGYPLTITGLQLAPATPTYTPGTVTIINGGTAISYTPVPGVQGYPADGFTYFVSDGHGGTAKGGVTVNVYASALPNVTITNPPVSPTNTTAGTMIPLTAYVTPCQYITNVTFYYGLTPIAVATNDGNGSFTADWTAVYNPNPGNITAEAEDMFGQVNTSPAITINVGLPPGATAPTALLDNYVGFNDTNTSGTLSPNASGSPANLNAGIFNIYGSATNTDGDAVTWQLDVYSADGSTLIRNLTPQPQTNGFYSGASGTLTSSNILATCDLTSLQNGPYMLLLRVISDYIETDASAPILLNSQLKIGEMTFSVQDSSIPVVGIPLSVTRTYNSFDPDKGDFGYCWTYSLNNMDIQLDETRSEVSGSVDEDSSVGDADQNVTFSERTGGGRDVTLTLPNGQRTTFYYTPSSDDPEGAAISPSWIAAPGTAPGYTLTVSGDPIYEAPGLGGNGWDIEGTEDYLAGYYNADFPGFVLTAPDGTQYIISRPDTGLYDIYYDDQGDYYIVQTYGQPYLSEIIERNQSTITIGSTGITYKSANGLVAKEVAFERNADNLITSISDPNAQSSIPPGPPTVKYEYDGNDNLIYVEKLVDSSIPSYVTNSYTYTNLNFPHYITGILNGDGTQVAQNIYNADGQLTETIDAEGNTTYFSNNPSNNTQTVVDRLGNTNIYTYDSRGNVLSETDALGETTNNAYDANNNLIETVDPLGNTNTYAYDRNGNRTMVVDALNHTNFYSYDGNGDLTSQTDPLGDLTTNWYDQNGDLTQSEQLDPDRNLITESSSTYNNGLLTQTENASGQVTQTFGYDSSSDYMTNSTDANNLAHTFAYDADGNPTNSSYVWTAPDGSQATVTNLAVYDAQGRVTMAIDPYGNTSQSFYNLNGQVSYTVDKEGNTNSFLYDARGNLIAATNVTGTSIYMVYDLDSHPILTTDPNGITGTFTQYDADGRVTNVIRFQNVQVSLIPDANAPGQMASTIVSLGTGLSTNSTTYYANGWIHTKTSPVGTTTYTYWPNGQTETVTDPLGDTTTNFYDDAGRNSLVVDANNHATRFVYDAVGRMASTIYDNNTSISNVYNSIGQRVGVVDQNGLQSLYAYDVAGNLTNVIKPQLPPSSPGWSFQYDENAQLTVTTDPNGHSTTNFNDALAHQIAQALPMGQTNMATIYNAKGQVWKQYDFMGQMIEHRYDNFGRETNKTYFADGAATASYAVSYAYNQLNQLTNVTQFYGSAASQFYATANPNAKGIAAVPAKLMASLNRYPNFFGSTTVLFMLSLAMAIVPAEKRRRFILAVGIEVTRLKSACRVVAQQRRIHMPSHFWRFVSPVTMLAVILSEPGYYEYCTVRADCIFPPNPSYQNVFVTTLTYDVQGNLTQVNSPEGVINYDYDLATGRLIHVCTLNSETEYSYDADGRLQTVVALKRNGSPIDETTTYHYDKVGNRCRLDLPNGIVTKYMYDDLNRLTNEVSTNSSGTLLASYSYVLDPTGKRTNAVEIVQQQSGPYQTNNLTWQYDAMYRLTNEVCVSTTATTTYAYTNAYTYDPVGNRLSKTRTGDGAVTDTYLYNANDELTNEVDGGTALNYLYDQNGSLTNKASEGTTDSYTYDLANKLRSVSVNNSLQASYRYDDNGIRTELTTQTSTTHFLIDANNRTGNAQVLEELQTLGGTPTMSYVIGDDVLAQCSGSTTTAPLYFLQDGHGNNRQLAQINGTVSYNYDYEAYGSIQSVISSSGEGAAATTKLFCGEQYDATPGMGLYNLRARYYDPLNGRFNQRDLSAGNNEDPQSLHKYLYVNCDPINATDPSGNFSLLELILVLLLIFFVVLPLIIHLQRNSVTAVTGTVAEQKESGQVNFYFTVNASAQKLADDAITGAAKSPYVSEEVQALGESTESLDNAAKFVALVAWIHAAKKVKDKEADREVLAACAMAGSDLTTMNNDILPGAFPNQNPAPTWDQLTSRDQIQTAGAYMESHGYDPDGVQDYMDDLKGLIEMATELAY